MPPRLASRPAQLNLASPKLIQPASAVKPSNDSTASLSVQMHGAIGQRESAEVNVDGDGAMLILDSNAPLTVEYQTVVIPGSTAKRWILRFKRADGDPTPLSPPSKATARVQFPVVGASSPSRQTQRDAFFWQSPSTPTDSRQMSTPQLSRLSGRKSISPERFEESCDSDSDEGSVVSSPPPATPRPLVYNVSTSTPSIKQTGEFQLRPMFPDFGPLSPKQIQRNGRSEAEEQPISPLQLNRHRHVRISSQDTVLGCRSPDEDYYGDVLGIFMGQLEDEDEVSDKQQVKVHPTASLAQRRGLKGSALKLPELAKREDGVEQSHWSETESDDNDLNNDSDS